MARKEFTIGEMIGMLHGMRQTLREQQAAVRESKKALAEMEEEIRQRLASLAKERDTASIQ